MGDTATTKQRSELMRRVKQKNTTPEIILRKALHKAGLRFRLHPGLPGTPDIVLPSRKLAIFVHGCFWHRHEGCKYATTPKSNRKYWLNKFDENVRRDKQKSIQLTKLGWNVMIVWECETKNSNILNKIVEEVLSSGTKTQKIDNHQQASNK
jgi:DNA mismatch endonuclease (patch repair protein)